MTDRLADPALQLSAEYDWLEPGHVEMFESRESGDTGDI